MNSPTPFSPLARTVLTRIHGAPILGRISRRRLALCLVIVGSITAWAWASHRGRHPTEPAGTAAPTQVRPAVLMFPATRIQPDPAAPSGDPTATPTRRP